MISLEKKMGKIVFLKNVFFVVAKQNSIFFYIFLRSLFSISLIYYLYQMLTYLQPMKYAFFSGQQKNVF